MEVLEAEIRQLRDALRTRGSIEQAKGVLMAQRGCGPDEAFALLTNLSQDTNTKLHEVARAFVDDFLAGLLQEAHADPAP